MEKNVGGRHSLGIVTAVLCIAVLFAPVAVAHDDGLVVIILTDEPSYGAGDTIEVTVHVLHGQEYVDPDQSPIVMFYLESYDGGELMIVNVTDEVPGREYTTQKVSTGIYRAEIQLFDSDTESDGSASIFLKPIYRDDEYYNEIGLTYGRGAEDDRSFDYFETSEWGGVDVEIEGRDQASDLTIAYEIGDISDCPWQPGDEVDLTVWVRRDGSNVKPDEFSVTDDEGEGIPYNNPSNGVYEVAYTIPTAIEENTEVGISIQAALEGVANDDVASLEVPFLVVLYQVWCHSLPPPNATARAFEIYVSDGEGRPVQGSTVGISADNGVGLEEYASTTDGSGKAAFVVGKGNGGTIEIEGWVKVGERNQTFYGSLSGEGEAPEAWEPDPSDYGFDVEVKPYEGSGPITLYAFMDGEPMEGVEIAYYMYTDRSLIAKGVVGPGADGKFTIDADVPDDDTARLLFVADDGYHPGVFVSIWNDTDSDGFSDKFEDHVGSDPDDAASVPEGYVDTDGDGFGDGFEESLGTDPEDEDDYPSTYRDSDGDGWGDGFEVENGTDPNAMWDYPGDFLDNDSDDHDDDEEAYYGTDPEDPEDHPFDNYTVNTDGDSIPVGYWDEDEQYDMEEVFYGSDPENATDLPVSFETSSDFDGVCDEEERFYGTDPEDSSDTPNDRPSPWDPRFADHNSTDGRKYVTTMDYAGTASIADLIDLENADIKMGVDELEVGGRTVVSVDSDTPQVFMGIVIYGDMDDLTKLIEEGEDYDPEWEMFEPDPAFPIYNTPDGHRGAFVLPSFLPKGSQEYTVLAGRGMDEETGISFNHVTLKDGESASTDDDGTDTNAAIIIGGVCVALFAIAVLAVVVVAIVVMASRRRRKVPDMASEDQEEEAAGEEGPAPPGQEDGASTPAKDESSPPEPHAEPVKTGSVDGGAPDAEGQKPPEKA